MIEKVDQGSVKGFQNKGVLQVWTEWGEYFDKGMGSKGKSRKWMGVREWD